MLTQTDCNHAWQQHRIELSLGNDEPVRNRDDAKKDAGEDNAVFGGSVNEVPEIHESPPFVNAFVRRLNW